MKKSWAPVIAILGFILIWEIFVVQPYNAKLRAQKASSTPPPATVTHDKSPAAPAPLPTTPVALKPLENAKAVILDLGTNRSVKIFPDGSIGDAEFRDYSMREQKEKISVKLLPQGLRWSSTNAAVSECLNQLKPTAASGEGADFAAQTSSGQCSVRYRRDQKPGLIAATVQLSGFSAPGGTLELRGYGVPGHGPALDHNFITYRLDDSKDTIREKKLREAQTHQGRVEWLVWGDRYFASVLLPRGNFNPNVVVGPVDAEVEGEKLVSFGFQYPLSFQPGQNTTYESGVYFGTRDPDSLSEITPTLKQAVDLGMFGAVGRAMLWALKRINFVFGNFGVSIIVLTLFVRLAFWPLNRKVYQSGLKMKALQPEIERVKKKYGDDKSKAAQMNMELIGLYKANKVNPMGSCLPLVLQMPIFFGLYGALNHALDLYQAPFFGWITDLSSKDPFYVFPALWTITLLAYIKLNPQQTAQPGQPDMKWLMIGMNIFFGFLSKDWPAGLTLYLFVSNLVGISQQYLMQRASKNLQPIQEGV